MRVFLSLLLSVLSSQGMAYSSHYESVFKCDGESDRFNWYCKEEKEEKPKNVIKPPEPKQDKDKKAPQKEKEMPDSEFDKALAEHSAMKKRLQDLLKVAYVNPTEENLRTYIAYQNMVTKKAAVFTDKWQRVLWKSPDLDYSQKHPIAGMAKAANTQELSKQERTMFKSLNEQGYGIFFFYRSDCPYCHKMISPIRIFKRMTGMSVLPISVDGVLLSKEFPGSIHDAGQARKLGVESTPSIYLVNPKTKDIKTIATGWISVIELKDRIFKLVEKKPGESY